MISIFDFLLSLRYHPSIQALIPVDVCMGYPLITENNLLYIPFIRMTGANSCVLNAEIIMEYPEAKLYSFHKVFNNNSYVFDERKLLQQTKKFYETYLQELDMYFRFSDEQKREELHRVKALFYLNLPSEFKTIYKDMERFGDMQ